MRNILHSRALYVLLTLLAILTIGFICIQGAPPVRRGLAPRIDLTDNEIDRRMSALERTASMQDQRLSYLEQSLKDLLQYAADMKQANLRVRLAVAEEDLGFMKRWIEIAGAIILTFLVNLFLIWRKQSQIARMNKHQNVKLETIVKQGAQLQEQTEEIHLQGNSRLDKLQDTIHEKDSTIARIKDMLIEQKAQSARDASALAAKVAVEAAAIASATTLARIEALLKTTREVTDSIQPKVKE